VVVVVVDGAMVVLVGAVVVVDGAIVVVVDAVVVVVDATMVVVVVGAVVVVVDATMVVVVVGAVVVVVDATMVVVVVGAVVVVVDTTMVVVVVGAVVVVVDAADRRAGGDRRCRGAGGRLSVVLVDASVVVVVGEISGSVVTVVTVVVVVWMVDVVLLVVVVVPPPHVHSSGCRAVRRRQDTPGRRSDRWYRTAHPRRRSPSPHVKTCGFESVVRTLRDHVSGSDHPAPNRRCARGAKMPAVEDRVVAHTCHRTCTFTCIWLGLPIGTKLELDPTRKMSRTFSVAGASTKMPPYLGTLSEQN